MVRSVFVSFLLDKVLRRPVETATQNGHEPRFRMCAHTAELSRSEM